MYLVQFFPNKYHTDKFKCLYAGLLTAISPKNDKCPEVLATKCQSYKGHYSYGSMFGRTD